MNDAAALVDSADSIVATALDALRVGGGPDAAQVLAYDIAHAASATAAARVLVDEAAVAGDELSGRFALAFAGDVFHDLLTRLAGRESDWGTTATDVAARSAAVAEPFAAARAPALLAELAEVKSPRGLDDDMELVADTFRSFATNVVAPHAEHVHRNNADVPEEIISGLAELGAFGLSVPVDYGGFSEGGDSEYLAMVIATEELSRASLGIGGSLITRPEILTRALVKGGTEEQKLEWLPRIAAGEIMNAVAVTEPDYGSDVANLTVTATPADGPDGAAGYVINGVKTWCTFAARADVLLLLARTDSDRSAAHRGLSLFIVDKPRGDGHGFEFREGDGRMEGRPIDTIGYRGMHSYEVAFENWWVAADRLIGGDDGLGRGFYFQMEGFENGRLQTAARAIGVMQAAYDEALAYSRDRKVFGTAIVDYELSQVKLGRMNVLIHAARRTAYHVATLMARGEGATEASMVKAYVCKAAEWVTREAMQLHGGFGYAEEYPVSRLFVDARVLSIFEGADETLCLKVIARRLVPAGDKSN